MKDLASLMEHIANTWVCDESRYKGLATLDAAQRKIFLVKHSLLHIGKTTGKIASVCESFDHDGVDSSENGALLTVGALKMFANALKLAEEVGLTADDLLTETPNFVK